LVSGWVVAVGVAGTVLLAVGAFSLSFTSLTHLATRSGIDAAQAWEWPLIVDGMIVVATVGVVALGGRKGAGFFWFLLVCGALVSVTGNALQAARLPTEEPAWVAAAVATIPPIVLLASTHMTVILTRPGTGAAPAPSAAGVADVPEPAEPDGPSVLARAERGVVPSAGGGHARTPAGRSAGFGEGSRTLKAEKAQRMRADGFTVGEIAQELGVSTGSVRRYLKPSPEPSADETGDIR
jgi:hypothetical protein